MIKNRLIMMNTRGLYGPMFQHVGDGVFIKSPQGGMALKATSGATRDATGAISATNITIYWSRKPDAANYLTGTDISVNGSTISHSLSLPVWTGSALTYTVTPALTDTDVIIWTLDNSGGSWTDPDTGEAISDQSVNVSNDILGAVTVESVQIVENRVADNRYSEIQVTFNQPVTSASAAGVTSTVEGTAQTSVLQSGSGTPTLTYRIQRAIFRHSVTWEYNSALGDISGVIEDLGDVPPQAAANNMPTFTVWDYLSDGNLGGNGNDTDTQWDTDTTRYDE